MENKINKIYEETNTTFDKDTGEIVISHNRQIVKIDKTPEFIMLFLKGIPQLLDASLSNMQLKVLWVILSNYVSKNNSLNLSTAIKKQIANEIGSTYRTVTQYINELHKKGIITKINYEGSPNFFLNPNIFGKGNWFDIKKLRYETAIEYDFEKKTALQTNKTISVFDTEEHNLKIVEAREEKKDKHTQQTLFVEEE